MTIKPYPYNEDQRAWLHDLETTKEPQTRKALYRIQQSDDLPIGFCCFGRACEVLGARRAKDHNLMLYEGQSMQLPITLVQRLRLRSSDGMLNTSEGVTSLTRANDLGWSFKEIAAFIRAHPWNVFLAPGEVP